MNKSIVLFAYSRTDLIRDSIKSILSAEGNSDWKKVLIHQVEFEQVDHVIKEYEKTIEDIQKFQNETKAMYLKGSNLDDKLYK